MKIKLTLTEKKTMVEKFFETLDENVLFDGDGLDNVVTIFEMFVDKAFDFENGEE